MTNNAETVVDGGVCSSRERSVGTTLSDQCLVECAWFPASGALALLNNSEEETEVRVRYPGGILEEKLAPREEKIVYPKG